MIGISWGGFNGLQIAAAVRRPWRRWSSSLDRRPLWRRYPLPWAGCLLIDKLG